MSITSNLGGTPGPDSVSSETIVDGGVKRDDLNVGTVGQAVIAKVIAGTGISILSSGADTGTGDVTISASGSGIPTRTAVADADYSITTASDIVALTSISTSRTFTLPAVAGVTVGKSFIITDESGSVNSVNKLIIEGNGAELIDGSLYLEIDVAYGSSRIYCTGSGWKSY